MWSCSCLVSSRFKEHSFATHFDIIFRYIIRGHNPPHHAWMELWCIAERRSVIIPFSPSLMILFYSILFLMIIHLAMFGWNLYTWREKKINYSFIFGFNPNVEIRYRELLLIVSCLSAITTGVLLGHFVIYADRTSSFLTVIMPLSVLLVCHT